MSTIQQSNSIYYFENKFINTIKEVYKKYNFNDDLKNFHNILQNSQYFTINDTIEIKKIKEIGINDRMSILYKDYHNFVDNNNLLNNVYIDFINEYVKPLYFCDKIVVQKTPNIRISFPESCAIGKNKYENEIDDIIGLHKDSDFGHHESEINFVIPITEMFDTNSIYYEPYQNSNLPKNEFLNLKLNTHEFFIEKFNKLLHFNKINKTGFTRISLDFRIIQHKDYFDNSTYFENTKFEIGKYYMII